MPAPDLACPALLARLPPQVNVSYVKLRDHLAAGEWREAEDELREVLIQAAGPAAVKRGWVYFSEVKFIPGGCCAALRCAALLCCF